MTALISLFTILLITSNVIVLVYIWGRRGAFPTSTILVMLPSILALLISSIYLVPDFDVFGGKAGRGFIIWLLLIGFMIVFGLLVFAESGRHRAVNVGAHIWNWVSAAWLIVFVLTALTSNKIVVGEVGWLASPGLVGITAVIGFVITTVFLSAILLIDLRGASTPESINRTIFWIGIAAITLMGVLLIGSGTPFLMIIGDIFMLVGIIGMIYTQLTRNAIDIRAGIEFNIRTLIIALISSIAVFTAVVLLADTTIEMNERGVLILGGLALVIAGAFAPLQQLLLTLLNQYLQSRRQDLPELIREYSHSISEAQTLDDIARHVTSDLRHILNVQRSVLILVESARRIPNMMELLILDESGEQRRTYLSDNSQIYRRLATDRSSISQFEIESSTGDTRIPQTEIEVFKSFSMSAFAPITINNVLVGILGCGPKYNGFPITRSDMELLELMAQQVGVTLRNARLIDDLQHLNSSMRLMNQGLASAKQDLERLDAVKTDFVTIASHELRTPLAQIRGYTDIIDAMNDQGILDKTHAEELTSNLRKATERMDGLITAMLDVSQLDVNAMDLRFVQTTVEVILRMSLEPLNDVMRQRRIALTVRGLRDMPKIQADMQRLVQAFRNVIVNAMKFTPDGGSINITAMKMKSDEGDSPEEIIISIADTGVGIASKHIDLIFDKFYRGYDPSLHSTGTYKFMGAGPGLGLTIARGIIEGHGGKVWAESPGHDPETLPGSTFFIRLPIKPPKGAWRIVTIEEDRGKVTGEFSAVQAESQT